MTEKVLKICEDLCCKKLSADEPLVITGLLDSFKIMELICRLEETFQIEFLPEEIADLDHLSCVDNMVAFIEKKSMTDAEKRS